MIDPYDLYQDLCSEANTFQGGFIPPETVFIRYVNLINYELWEMGCRESEKSQEWRDNMTPFLISKNIITNPATSYYTTANLPTDYGRLFKASMITVNTDTSIITIPNSTIDKGNCYKDEYNQEVAAPKQSINDYLNSIKEVDITEIDLQRWDACLNHVFDDKRPSMSKPKMVQVNGGFNVAPRGVSVVVLYYFRLPKQATFAYTTTTANLNTGAGGQIVYDAKNSQKLEWGVNLKNEFVGRLLEKFGIVTRDQFIEQYSLHRNK